MIKIICDRCRKDITGDADGRTAIGYIAWNFRDGPDDDLMHENIFEKIHYCRDCMEEVREFICRTPQQGEPCQQEDVPENTRKRNSRVDIGKIMALRTAGWTIKNIADEMNMTPSAVSGAIHYHGKKNP